MTDPSWKRLRDHTARVGRMIEDPDLTGDLLLIGISLARMIDLDGWPVVDGKRTATYEEVSRGVFGPDVRYRVSSALRGDLPRYEGPWARREPGVCEAPMQRLRPVCGRRGKRHEVFRDPATGESYLRWACDRRDHQSILHMEWRQHRSEILAMDLPEPAQNAGGALERHLPEVKWEPVYETIQPGWKRPPSAPRPTRPTLTLIPGGAS